MDDLRWILAIAGAVVVAAIFISGRFEREEWRRDREQAKRQPQSPVPERVEPKIENLSEVAVETQADTQLEPRVEALIEVQGDLEAESRVEFEHESQTETKPAGTVKKAPTQKKSASRKESVGLNSEEDVSKALGKSEQKPSEAKQKSQESKDEWEGAVDSAREPLIEDEIVSVEIPAEFSEYGEERRSRSRLKFKPEIEEPAQQELVLDLEPLVLVLTILAKNESQLNGGDIKKALEAEGIEYGDMEIFHYHMGGEKDAVFSVANLVEPGTFDLTNINECETPGLSLFCQIPGPVASTVAFELLLKMARSIADALDGQLCDDKRNKLTEQTTTHYRDRIAAYDHEMVLARKKQE